MKKAIILAAGLGTRLRPLTNDNPKCLVTIKGIPLIDIWLNKLDRLGIEDFLINTHYLPEKVTEHILKSRFKDRVRLIHENKLEGTAGTLIKNIDFYENNDGLIMHGDNFTSDDLKNFFSVHRSRPKKCLMTMMLFRTNTPSSSGIVRLNDNNIVTHFYEKIKDPPSNLANGAIYIITKKLIDILKDKKNITDISTQLIPMLLGKIMTYETKCPYVDIGNINSYNYANKL